MDRHLLAAASACSTPLPFFCFNIPPLHCSCLVAETFVHTWLQHTRVRAGPLLPHGCTCPHTTHLWRSPIRAVYLFTRGCAAAAPPLAPPHPAHPHTASLPPTPSCHATHTHLPHIIPHSLTILHWVLSTSNNSTASPRFQSTRTTRPAHGFRACACLLHMGSTWAAALWGIHHTHFPHDPAHAHTIHTACLPSGGHTRRLSHLLRTLPLACALPPARIHLHCLH